MTPEPDEKAHRILAAARTILARDGFAAATISQVAAEAGVSRGLVHYHFRNKADMLARVVEASIEGSVDLVAAMFRESETAEELAASLAAGLRNIVEHDPAFFHVFFESWAVGRQNPEVAREVRALYRRFRRAVRDGTERAAKRGVIRPMLPLDGLAAALTGLIDGLALQLVTEPELIGRESVWQAAQAAILALLGRGTE